MLGEDEATTLAEQLTDAPFVVRTVDEKPYTRRPAAPFRTSTLQQEASRKLRFSSQTTMRHAQRLYENGYITYMRTDSVNLSESALTAARAQATELYGAEYVPASPRRYERAVKNAQEAHEAIRPAGDTFRTPAQVERELSRDEHALYDLIWKRTIASQMEDARGQTVSLRLGATSSGGADAEFGASGTVITFRGFLAAYQPGRDDPADEDEERPLPHLAVGDAVTAEELRPDGHATTPPARYTEASLVKALEDRGIGRPSTYASILGTILDRGYVFKKGTALVPTFLAFAVTRLLEEHFERLVDYDFTARMEDDLDRIAAGDEHRVEWLERFYFGNGGEPGPARARHRPPRRDRRPRRQLDPDPGQRRRRARRALRPVPRARGRAGEHPRRPGTRRADRRDGRGAARATRAATASSASTPRRGTRSRRVTADTGRT